MTDIKAIECPKCGNTHKTVIRPGDFRCASCGTEYFIDDGTVKFGQRPPVPGGGSDNASPRRGAIAFWCAVFVIVGVIVGVIGVVAHYRSDDSTNTSDARRHYTWYGSYADALYLAADKRPVLLTLGSQVDFSGAQARADYIAFIDARDNSTIKSPPLPDTSSIADHSGGTNFDLQQFANGDIFFIVEKSQLFRVQKFDYSVSDVTQSLFADQPDLAQGVAKIEFRYPHDGQGFKLITNDGKPYFYDARTRVVATTESNERAMDAADYAANTEIRTAFSFSMRYDSDFPELPGLLVAFTYRAWRDWPEAPVLDYHSRGLASSPPWDDPSNLARAGALSHRDFTPGKTYFDYGVLYFDSDFVLISYRATPKKNEPRVVQLLDAKTAAILFTTPLDVTYAPTECIRYKDGFVIASLPATFTLSLAGKLEKHTPFMFDK